ncbi:hypothetical protein HZS91_02109 [Xanthomonas citri pv. citri]|nr:hypothetical protein HZS91_02109 [Xanthomonas citri pv. citri]
MPHARTFFHRLAHQALDLAGRNVGKPQFQVHLHGSLTVTKPSRPCLRAWRHRSAAMPVVKRQRPQYAAVVVRSGILDRLDDSRFPIPDSRLSQSRIPNPESRIPQINDRWNAAHPHPGSAPCGRRRSGWRRRSRVGRVGRGAGA